MKVKKNTLLLIACIVWAAAGFNVLRIGVIAYPAYVSVVNFLLSILIFGVFQVFIFGKLVKKHTARIRAYEQPRQFFLRFFDVRSFVIMAVMMSGGIVLRHSPWVPERFIAVFYTGLGASLLLAGVLFGVNYVKASADPIGGENKGEILMKRYADSAIIYAVAAMIFGVFYREYTKIAGFDGKTVLSVMHTHYFALGMVFFLLLLLLEKSFAFSDKKTGRILAAYHVGLNITGAVFLARGILQVQGSALSKGLNASLSGTAGIGHMLLGISMEMVLLQIRRQAVCQGQNP